MEYINISETKIKLMLDQRDVRTYDFDPLARSSAGEKGTSFLRGFRRMLRDVRAKTGFDDEGKRLLVRYFYSGDGGCEMYITKLSDPTGRDGERNASAGSSVRNLNGTLLFRRDRTEKQNCRTVYRFCEMEDLIMACGALRQQGFRGVSRAFSDGGSPRSYYLVLDRETPLLAEYNGVRLADGFYYFAEEHFKRFSDDPVSVLGGMC